MRTIFITILFALNFVGLITAMQDSNFFLEFDEMLSAIIMKDIEPAVGLEGEQMQENPQPLAEDEFEEYCPCGFIPFNKMDLKRHINDSHQLFGPFEGKFKKRFKCPAKDCRYITTAPSRITNHFISHTEVRPIKCNHCGKKLTSKNSLNYHMYAKHSKLRPYACVYYSCKSTYVREVDLWRHVLLKHYYCSRCGIFFEDGGQSQEHREKVHARKNKEKCLQDLD